MTSDVVNQSLDALKEQNLISSSMFPLDINLKNQSLNVRLLLHDAIPWLVPSDP